MILIKMILLLFILLYQIEQNAAQSQFCSTVYTTVKEDRCPDPTTFDILQEYHKPFSSWKLNFPVSLNGSDTSVIDEISKRYYQGIYCPYIRKTNRTVCCNGWYGLACDQSSPSSLREALPFCHLWGQDHLRTLDGTYYRFPGRCVYKLIGSTTWQINIDYRNCSSNQYYCDKTLTITIHGKTLEIIGTTIHNTTSYPSGLIIRRQDRFRLDLYFTNGLRLKIDRYQGSILVQFDPALMTDENLSGLCGDYNHQSKDDLKLFMTGEITSVPVDFGNQWKLDRNCPDVSPVLNSCSLVPEVIDTVIEACEALTNQTVAFASCLNQVDMQYFYDACLNDICSAMVNQQPFDKIRCHAVEAYVDECQEHHIYPVEWRSETSCSKRCSSPNMMYVECVSSCPATCQNPQPSLTSCHASTEDCTPGCVCAIGTVYDPLQDRCVPLEQCSCQYQNQFYRAGDHVNIDCNDCQCDHGRWVCTNRTCPRTCVILGDMNIWTFDGKQYALATSCKHVLVEMNDRSNYLRITYSKQENDLTVEILNTRVTFGQDDVIINGNIRHTLPYQTEDTIIRRASTAFLEVRDIRSSVVVHFDASTSRLYIKLEPSFLNRVRGLCGTFNYITNDDFLTPNSLIETNLITFANAYLASSCSVSDQQTDACLNFPANEYQARFECTNLLKDPIFSACTSHLVDLSFFLSACIRDLCADQSSFHRDQVKCSVLTALSSVCARKGIVIEWSNNDTLARSCQIIHYGQCGSASGATYSECVSECQSSCTDMDLMPSSCTDHCLAGCQCPKGQLYDEHSHLCRRPQECPCYEPHSEQYIHPSHSLVIQTPIQATCSCSNGSLKCSTDVNKQCASTQIYALNTSLCPRTCANYLSYYDCGLYGPGCTCPPGQILLDSNGPEPTCVRIDQCPCQYNRQFYLENETIIQMNQGCQNCTCQKGGIWSCQKMICKKICTAFGHSHYQTFDGFYYNFPGQCQYILAQEKNDLFRILSENIPCGMNGQICAKNILIEYTGVTIDLMRDRPVLVNNIELLNYQIQPVTFGSIHIYQLGIYTMIKTDDFVLRWDGQTYVEIEVASSKDMVGLCGNNNDNLEDDLNGATGVRQANPLDMAQSWRTSVHCLSISNQSTSDDPCGDRPEHEQRRVWARSQCDLIKIKSSIDNNPFELCIDRMDASLIEKYYQACLYDACHADRGGDCESVCTVLSAYASHCQSIIGTPIIKWRSADRCPVQCDGGKVYMACGPRCPQTCFDNEEYGGCIADSGCVDGCFCPNGQVMDNQGQCVEPRQCPCLYDNRVYPQSSRILIRDKDQCQRECECRNGSFICEELDETACVMKNCTSNEFMCQSTGQCIPLPWKCDQVIDCPDGSDEMKDQCQDRCQNQTGIFQCANGQCIDSLRRCDGLPDCRDGSDEMNCTYLVPCKEYQCPISQRCIPKSWICDGTVDCGRNDNSDESGDCKLNQCDTASGRYFQCRDNFNCLPIEHLCDAHQDCHDGSDEAHCSSCTCTSSFTCLHTCQCLDSRRVCDGVPDCIDGTDEHNCTASCQDGEYTCLDGKCLNRTLLCDGIQHCTKGEDEAHPDCLMGTTSTTVVYQSRTTTGSPEEVLRMTAPPPKVSEPLCESELILINEHYMTKPESSVRILGSFRSLNPDEKGVTFKPSTASTPIFILLKFKRNIILNHLVRLEIPRPSNVNRFQVTFLDRYRRAIGRYGILSTESSNLFVSPMIDRSPLDPRQMQRVRALKITIVDTDDDRVPSKVTVRLEGCLKRKKLAPKKKCVQIDAMNARYTTRIIRKLGGTRPVNSTFGHLLRGYGGVTYNTSQAVIDVRIRNDVLSNLKEISIPDYRLGRTNVKKMIVELFDRYHRRLFRKKTNRMRVHLRMKRRFLVRFIRVSMLDTNDNYAPFNVTLSIKGCFYRKRPRRKTTRRPLKTKTTTMPSTVSTSSPCYHVNALDPSFAHRIIGQFEGTEPISSSSFLNFIEPGKKGVSYAIESPTIVIRFQPNVVGQLNRFAILGRDHNIGAYRLELFDFNHQLLFSNESTAPHFDLQLPIYVSGTMLFVSSVQVTILNTIDHRLAHGIQLSLTGCFSTMPSPLTTIGTTTTVAPTTLPATFSAKPRKCHQIELMNDSRIIIGLTSSSPLVEGDLGKIYHHDVTFADRNATIDIVFEPNLLVYLNEISIESSNTNLKRFRLELLNNENSVQHTIESSSMRVHLESLPSVIIAGIRLTFLQTRDRQPASNIRLSIRGCVEQIFVPTPLSTTTPQTITTTRSYPRTTPITPDRCLDIDAMQAPYSSQTLAGIAGTNPQGVNASLLDLLEGKPVSFNMTDERVVLFIIFKSNLFVYLKHVGLVGTESTNVKRIRLDYLDQNQLLIRTFIVDYSTNQTTVEPMREIHAIRITIEETLDKRSVVENLRLTVRGCFGIRLIPATSTVAPTLTSTTSTPCHSLNLLSNATLMRKVIAYLAGTNPQSGSILDYLNGSIPVSYNTSEPTLIIVFKSDIYAELRSISLMGNLRRYRLDFINYDRTILQGTIIDTQQQKPAETYPVPIYAIQITYLDTIDGQPPKNILLKIEGCFGIHPFPPPNSIIETTTARITSPTPIALTTSQCHEIEMMNRVDSIILIESITGTLPSKETNSKLTDYFDETALISYDKERMPITFLIILKQTIAAEIHTVSLVNPTTNVKRFQVDLIDDYKSIIQTVQSNENLTAESFSAIAIAAIRITYLETNDEKPPRNLRLSIRGCFGHLPYERRTTPATTLTTTKAPGTTKKPLRRKCKILDAMSEKHRQKILQAMNHNDSLRLFSMDGLSFKSVSATLDIAFQPDTIGNIENITLIGDQHNVQLYQVIFFGINHRVLGDSYLRAGNETKISVAYVNAIRFIFLETIDRKNIRGVKLSIRGCFFRLPSLRRRKPKLDRTKKPVGYCREVNLFNRTYAKRLLRRIGGSLDLSQLSKASSIRKTVNHTNESLFFVLEFRRDIFMRHLRQVSINLKNHQVRLVRIELENKHGQLLKRMDVSLLDETSSSPLFVPIYPIHVRYLKLTILKGKPMKVMPWSITGCFYRLKRIKTVVKTLEYAWWTVKCIHSNIVASRRGHHRRRSLKPSITGTPLPIDGHFRRLLRSGPGISYDRMDQPIMIDITFPPGIIGRLYEVGIRSDNVYRIRVQLIEVPNGILYTLTSPHDNQTERENTNPRLIGFPPVQASGIRIILLETNDGQAPRRVKIYTNGCFYKSSVRYTTLPGLSTIGQTTTQRPPTTSPTTGACTYSPWTRWRQCSVTCGTGVQIRARNQLSGTDCNEPLIDYRMCQLQPCMCILTKEFYTSATGQPVPANNIVGYVKRTQEPVHIGDVLDTGTIIYTYNCSRFICLNVGLHLERAKTCQRKCIYRPWSSWGPCRGRCGNPHRSGRQYRQRYPLHILSGSHLCPPEREYRSCRTPPCFGPCILAPWSKWSRCSKSCGLGVQRRTRFYLSMQPNCTDHLEERRDCNPQCCPSKKKPMWSAWGPWSECNADCDGGERVRYRTCQKESSPCQQTTTCPGSDRQVEPCHTEVCVRTGTTKELECAEGQVLSNCSNACSHTCNTLTCRSCHEPSQCVPGCVCPPPLVMNTDGECVEVNRCLCPTSDGKSVLLPGQFISDQEKCEDCRCLDGCLQCSPSTKVCESCPWSEWSPYGICSSDCNGTQTRYRSRSCTKQEPEFEYENRTCSTNQTFYQKGCAQCSCNATTGEETCHVQCAITPEICSNLTNDPLANYEYIPPSDGECCGSCRRVNKTEICSVEQLPMDFISIGDCISMTPIPRQRCLGTCISGSVCRCCSPKKITIERILMNCESRKPNSRISFNQEMSYAKIESCACEECR